jgi:hypothetical protein
MITPGHDGLQELWWVHIHEILYEILDRTSRYQLKQIN